jgi:undecaprenyl-diphosphatase
MLAATGLDLVKSGVDFSVQEWGLLGVGTFGAFVSAVFVVSWLTGYVRRHGFEWFGWYRIGVGLIWLLSA